MNNTTKYLMSTDGSNASKDSFYQLLEFFKDNDYLIVSHIFNPKKTYLPYDF